MTNTGPSAHLLDQADYFFSKEGDASFHWQEEYMSMAVLLFFSLQCRVNIASFLKPIWYMVCRSVKIDGYK